MKDTAETVEVPRALLGELARQARREAPREVCGWLVGRKPGAVSGARPVPNAAPDPEREFVMEPQAQLDALRSFRRAGLALLGTYHSHPRSAPVPSERDAALALYPGLVHLIVSPGGPGGRARFGLWRITGEGRREVILGVSDLAPGRPGKLS